jgi:hypothetical protein
MKTKKILTSAIFLPLFLPLLAWAASFSYTPMEQIPGFATDGNFYNYISAVYNFGIWGVGVSALLMITIGGYMYISSAANVASVDKSKAVITDAVIGLILALISYLLLYVINPNLVRLDKGEVASTATTTTVTTTTAKETAIREQLKQVGIEINNGSCPAGQNTGCTNVGGLKDSTIAGVTGLKTSCPSCPIKITGGSEAHTAGTFSHANGYKVDLATNSKLDSYIESFTPAGERREKNGTVSKLYTDSQGNTYAKEINPPHWDVCYNCK